MENTKMNNEKVVVFKSNDREPAEVLSEYFGTAPSSSDDDAAEVIEIIFEE